jgi:DpnII restriction endonuclease
VKPLQQDLDALVATLTEMDAAWLDDTASKIISTLGELTDQKAFDRDTLRTLLEKDFDSALTIFRLFLDLSKDRLETVLPAALGAGGAGITRYRADPDTFLDAIERLGVLTAMDELANRPLRWTDLLVERLKSGRGRAIRGQRGGRSLEDFVEVIVARVFGEGNFDSRCSFVGKDGVTTAKADFAIPSKSDPRIVIESKGYAATGSKQTDVIGDLQKIITAKRNDSTLLLVTDGLTWRRRMNDLRTIVQMQNRGEVARIYTRAMVEAMESDLRILKSEHEI